MTDFNSKKYKKVMAANKRRNAIPTMDWTPLKEDKPKECVHSQLWKAQELKININQDSNAGKTQEKR